MIYKNTKKYNKDTIELMRENDIAEKEFKIFSKTSRVVMIYNMIKRSTKNLKQHLNDIINKKHLKKAFNRYNKNLIIKLTFREYIQITVDDYIHESNDYQNIFKNSKEKEMFWNEVDKLEKL